MTELRPCPECNRHVRADHPACPFCGAESSAPPAPRRAVVGRLTRAAIFAGALATGAAACGTNPEPVEPTGDNTKTDDTKTDDTDPIMNQVDTATADAGVPEGPPPPPDAAVDDTWDSNPIPKPYGAPPARHRVV